MLGMLPTDPRLLEVLRSALSSERPAEALKPLLEGSAAQSSPPAQPTRLLYTLEVCLAPYLADIHTATIGKPCCVAPLCDSLCSFWHP